MRRRPVSRLVLILALSVAFAPSLRAEDDPDAPGVLPRWLTGAEDDSAWVPERPAAPPVAPPPRAVVWEPGPAVAFSRAYVARARSPWRWRVRLEGSGSRFPDPEGPFGLPPPSMGLTWDPLSYDPALGGRAAVAFRPTPCLRLEVRGFTTAKADDANRQTGRFGFSPPANGVSPVFSTTLHSEAETYGGDAMGWFDFLHRGRWTLSAGVGGRWSRFAETAEGTDWTEIPDLGRPALRCHVDNDFFGGVVGLESTLRVGSRVDIEVTARGLLGSMRRKVDLMDKSLVAGGTHENSAKKTSTAWGVDLEASVIWHLSNHVGVRGGYQLLFLDEVQRANEAMDFTQANTKAVQIQSSPDTLVVHTLFLGVEIDF